MPWSLTTLLVFLTLSACQSSPPKTSPKSPQPQQPNIIVLFADDMGYGDIASYGSPSIRTPKLDQLAREGQRWTNFYVASPVCSPSRGALMTGNLPIRSGLYGLKRAVLFPNELGAIPDQQVTLPEALKEAGYDTAMFGKWHLGDQPAGLPTRHGFDQWFGIPYSNDMDWEIGPSSPELFAAGKSGNRAYVLEAIADRKKYTLDPKNEYWNVPLIQSIQTENGYDDKVVERPANQKLLTKSYTQKSVEYIQNHAKNEKPFFLYLAYAMPHAPLFRSDEFVDASAAGRYGDVIEEIDWSVGEIRKALEGQGIAENTLIVFSSDNGPWLIMDQDAGSAGPFSGGKGTTFEGGMRVPGIFWWPKTIQPKVVTDIGSVMDLYATSLSLAGTSANEQVVDSVDLSDALRGKESPRKDLAYYRSGQLYAYRQGQYKIHLITQGSYGAPPQKTEHESPLLYHLGQDPGERFNIAEQKPQVVQQLLEAVELHRAGLLVAEPIFDLGRE